VAALIGFVLALLVAAYARWVGLDRERAFYPTVLAVIASYYDLFAVMGGSIRVLLAEATLTVAFFAVVALGFRRNLWLVAAGLLGHGVMDLVHARLIANPGVPAWWPAWCCAYDVTAAGCLAALLLHGHIRAKPSRHYNSP
jgi:hypothetical protein